MKYRQKYLQRWVYMYHTACSRQHKNMAQFNIIITAQSSSSNSNVLCNFSSAAGEHHSNKRAAHSERNKVSIESIEVDIFRVIYGPPWIISVCTWSTSTAHFMRLFLCILHLFFCITALNFRVNSALTRRDFSGRVIHLIEKQFMKKRWPQNLKDDSRSIFITKRATCINDQAPICDHMRTLNEVMRGKHSAACVHIVKETSCIFKRAARQRLSIKKAHKFPAKVT